MISDGVRVPHRVFVPGKLMFSGEYSVLLGNLALSTSLNTYMGIEVIKNQDKELRIYSSFYSKGLILKSREDILKIESVPLKEVLMFCLDHSEINMFQFDLKEISTWKISSGFGSSSALILSMLYIFLSYKYKKEDILYHAYSIEKKYQGYSSGYDVVTQMVGGMIEYRYLDIDENEEKNSKNDRFYEIKPIAVNIDMNRYIHIFTSNIGSNTSRLIKKTLSFLEDKKEFSSFIDVSNELSSKMLSFLKEDNSNKVDIILDQLFDIVDRQQSFFYDTSDYPDIIKILKKDPLYKKDFIIKTTGAGGNDAILIIGDIHKINSCFSVLEKSGWNKLVDPFSKIGAYCED